MSFLRKTLTVCAIATLLVVIIHHYHNSTFNEINDTLRYTNTTIHINNRTVSLNQYERHIHDSCIYHQQKDTENTPNNLIGHSHVIEEINYMNDMIKSNTIDPCMPKKILLHGPPGTGKSTLAKSISKILGNVSLLHVSIDQIENKFYGEGLKILRSVFTLSNKIAPCVIFFDEVDGIMNNRSENDQSHTTSLKTTFLTCIDEMKHRQIYLIAATNRPSTIDTAFMRRMDIHMEMDSPSHEDKYEYISKILNLPSDNDNVKDEYMRYIQEYWISSSISDIERFYNFLKRHWWIENKSKLPSNISLENVKKFSNKYKKYIYGKQNILT